jgi:hypothetical protein
VSKKRKGLSKKLRFEVFKRDSFACQYCGKKAPDVLLVLDHITPVAEGGTDDILNLITACFECNAGKGARLISDHSTLKVQQEQLARLNEKRLQLEMMLQWRKELEQLQEVSIKALFDRIVEVGGPKWRPNERGEACLRTWLRKFSLGELLQAADTSFAQYNQQGTRESWAKSFDYIPKIAANNRKFADDPTLRDLYYIRGILRNRLNYLNEWMCLDLLKEAREAGATIASMYEMAKSVTKWTEFQQSIEKFLAGQQKKDNQDAE